MIKELFEKLLVVLEFKEPSEIIEYNVPLEPLPQTYYEMIHGDVNFTLSERIEISKAVQEWNIFCDGYIRLDIIFDYTPANASLPIPRTAIIKASDKHPLIKNYQESKECSIYGLYLYDYKRGPTMFLCYEKLKTNSLLWRLVALHELGHYLGLAHVENAHRAAIMQAYSHTIPSTLTKLDAIEFARIYGVNPEQLVYRL